MKFFGSLIGEVTETDESYLFTLLADCVIDKIFISCFVSKEGSITKQKIEQYISSKKRVIVSSVIVGNSIVNKGSLEEPNLQAELKIGVYKIE